MLSLFYCPALTSIHDYWKTIALTVCQPAAAAAKLLQSCPTLCDPIDGRQPTRLHHPWDSPGKNTGVGCHFLLQCMKVKSESEVAQSCPTLGDPMDYSPPGPPSMGFSRQEYWSRVPLPSPLSVLPIFKFFDCFFCLLICDVEALQ